MFKISRPGLNLSLIFQKIQVPASSRPTTFGSWIPIRELNPFAYFEKELYSVFRVYVPECLYFVHYANQILKILNIHIHVKNLLFVLFMEHVENLSQKPLNVKDFQRHFEGVLRGVKRGFKGLKKPVRVVTPSLSFEPYVIAIDHVQTCK